MTCKNCIHYDVCTNIWTYVNRTLECRHFKDKSKQIELPCKVGDVVYYIAGKRIYKSNVHCISFGGRNNFASGQIHIYDYDGDNVTRTLSDFGKTVFLTKQEVEAKLREVQENA